MSDRISFFLQKLKENPHNLLNKFSLSQAYFESGAYGEAIPHLESCIQGRNDWMMAYLLLGKSYIANDQEELAVKPLECTIKLAIEQNHEDPEIEARNLLSEISNSST
jgi:tetratricopeptide (TPR) repeat protein